MATTNDVTGDPIQSRNISKAYADNWDRIFKKKEANNEESGKPLEGNVDEDGNK